MKRIATFVGEEAVRFLLEGFKRDNRGETDGVKKRRMTFDTTEGDVQVRIGSSRLMAFKRSCGCQRCKKRTGNMLAIEYNSDFNDGHPHFNLYNVDDTGKEMLMVHRKDGRTVCFECHQAIDAANFHRIKRENHAKNLKAKKEGMSQLS